MHNFLRTLLAVIVFTTVTSCTGASARGRITQLSEIQIRPGTNQITMFVDDGRSGMVTKGWRDLGKNAGYSIYTVMIPSAVSARGWDIVPVEGNQQETPDISGPARFARGYLDGKPTTFLFTAHRDTGANTAKPGPMVIEAYHLVTARESDKSENAFVPVTTITSTREYCSPDAAIAHQFDLGGDEDRVRAGGCV